MRPTRRQIASAHAAWEKDVVARLPGLLADLLASPVYGLGPNRSAPPATHGVYLFSDDMGPMYVGRAGWTERARRAGRPGFSNFNTRLRSHTYARDNEGTFAYRLTCEEFRKREQPLGLTRATNCANEMFMVEFRRQCARVTLMEFRIIEITNDRLAAVFEIYAATVLRTRYNSFATS